jgi:peptide deformylase
MITMNDIIQDGHPTLRKAAEDVPMPPTNENQQILKSLLEYIQNSQNTSIAEEYSLRPGVGLAAPQINVSKQMIAVQVREKDKIFSYALFNPKIVSHSVEKSFLTTGEGCLSVEKDIQGYVHRHARITVKGFSINGEEIKLRLKGLQAIVFQHEIDHLKGIMFYDYIDPTNPFKKYENAVPIER